MSLETAQYIHQLNASNPSGADRLKDGDDHLRMIKAALLATFPGIKGPLDASVTHTLLNGVAALLVPIGIIALWSGTEAAVPVGWAICDGRTVTSSDGSRTFATPNLKDFVPVGVSASHAVNTTYGGFSKTITTEQAGQHTHTATTSSAGGHSHGGATGVTALSVDQVPSHSHNIVQLGSSENPLTSSPQSPVAQRGTYGNDPEYLLTTASGGQWAGPSESKGGGQGHSHSIAGDGNHTHPVTVDAGGSHSHAATVDVTQPSYAIYFIMKI